MKKTELINIIRKELKNIQLNERQWTMPDIDGRPVPHYPDPFNNPFGGNNPYGGMSSGGGGGNKSNTCSPEAIASIKRQMQQKNVLREKWVMPNSQGCCNCDGRFMPCDQCPGGKNVPPMFEQQQRGGNNLAKLDPNLLNHKYLEATIKRMKSEEEFIRWYNGIFMGGINAGMKIPTGQEVLANVQRENPTKRLNELWYLVVGAIAGVIYAVFKAASEFNDYCCDVGWGCCMGGGMIDPTDWEKMPADQTTMMENRKYGYNKRK